MKIIFSMLMIFISLSAHSKERCNTEFDATGIPLVTTQDSDFYFCFGLLHGSDRAWEMDYFRRVAQGMNAEVLGWRHIETDYVMRLLEIEKQAHRLYEDMPQKYKDILAAYTQGVNLGLKTGRRQKEFKKLNYEMKDWEPVHSVYVLLVQSFDQTKKTFALDFKEHENLKNYEDATNLFDENLTPWFTSIIKTEELRPHKNITKNTVYSKYSYDSIDFPELFGENSGSNNWVVSPKLTSSKKAILANDPHLDLKTPMFWYWLSIKTDKRRIIGASLPGIPFVASGTNGFSSWGLTNSYMNSADAVEITDAKKSQLTYKRPLIWFKFGPFKLPFVFKTTAHYLDKYPLIPMKASGISKVFLRWSVYDLKGDDVVAIFDLLESKNVNEVSKHLKNVGLPSWNYVFSDTLGNIGYQMVGKTYHNQSQPYGIMKMTGQEFINPAYLASSDSPSLINPKRNWVATANNAHWPGSYDLKGGQAYSMGFRAHRIEEKLKSTNNHSVDSFIDIACDSLVTDAQFFVPVVRKVLPEFVKGWDFNANSESRELSLYRRFIDLVMEEWKVNETALYNKLVKEGLKNRDDLIRIHQEAMRDIKGRPWRDLSYLPFSHISGLEELNFSPELKAIGDEHTVGPATTKWNSSRKQYEQVSGASMRMIVEMSNPVKVYFNFPGRNRNYSDVDVNKDDFQAWSECRYHEIVF